MFYYLRGEVALIDLGMVVLDCGGVGFTVNTTTNTISKLKPGEETRAVYPLLHPGGCPLISMAFIPGRSWTPLSC